MDKLTAIIKVLKDGFILLGIPALSILIYHNYIVQTESYRAQIELLNEKVSLLDGQLSAQGTLRFDRAYDLIGSLKSLHQIELEQVEIDIEELKKKTLDADPILAEVAEKYMNKLTLDFAIKDLMATYRNAYMYIDGDERAIPSFKMPESFEDGMEELLEHFDNPNPTMFDLQDELNKSKKRLNEILLGAIIYSQMIKICDLQHDEYCNQFNILVDEYKSMKNENTQVDEQFCLAAGTTITRILNTNCAGKRPPFTISID